MLQGWVALKPWLKFNKIHGKLSEIFSVVCIFTHIPLFPWASGGILNFDSMGNLYGTPFGGISVFAIYEEILGNNTLNKESIGLKMELVFIVFAWRKKL